MLELKNIVKEYKPADETVTALKGVSTEFRSSEFVSILGPSGCGKTTLLNIIGGLDRYTSGDLIINGKSTKDFSDKEWDTYRNHSVGFVFQSYNLIPHQTVAENVELALTLSGIGAKERHERAVAVLEKVGLGNKINARPNQLSGGQMQRVAIARALINDPEILLADEPTGALDSKTSVQIMELLKEISHDRLIVMVTHNPELAEKYSSRIIRLLDGELVGDDRPLSKEEEALEATEEKKEKRTNKGKKKTSMSFFTALALQKPYDQKGQDVSRFFRGQHRHYRYRAYIVAFKRLSVVYQPHAGRNACKVSDNDSANVYRYDRRFRRIQQKRRSRRVSEKRLDQAKRFAV